MENVSNCWDCDSCVLVRPCGEVVWHKCELLDINVDYYSNSLNQMCPKMVYKNGKMILETLRGLDSIGDFKVVEIFEREDGKFQVDYTENTQCPVMINHCENSITFFLQNGPIKEAGVNGCQVDTMIETAWKIINGFNEAYPCKENNDALYHLHEALVALDNRKNRRIAQGIEGTGKEIK